MLRQATKRVALATGARYLHATAASRLSSTTVASASEESGVTVAPPGDGPNHRSIMSLDGNSIRPHVQPNSFVAPSASVIGSVAVNDKSMISYGSVLRGDLALIHIGFNTNIGENCVITAGEVVENESSEGGKGMYNEGESSEAPIGRTSLSKGMAPSDAIAAGLTIEPELVVGDYCDVGANTTLQSCFLEGDNKVGHGCVIEQGASMARYSELLPNSVLKAGQRIEEREIWGGAPAVKLGITHPDDNVPKRKAVIASYATTKDHMYEFLPVGFGYLEKEAMEAKS